MKTHKCGSGNVSIDATKTVTLPIKNSESIHAIVLKCPNQLSAMIAPKIGKVYESNSLVWKIAVEVSGSKFNFRFRYNARMATKTMPQ